MTIVHISLTKGMILKTKSCLENQKGFSKYFPSLGISKGGGNIAKMLLLYKIWSLH